METTDSSHIQEPCAGTAPSWVKTACTPTGAWSEGAPGSSLVTLEPRGVAPSGRPELLPFGDQTTALTISRTGRLVYATQFRDTNLRRLDLSHISLSPDQRTLLYSMVDAIGSKLMIVDGFGIRERGSLWGQRRDEVRTGVACNSVQGATALLAFTATLAL